MAHLPQAADWERRRRRHTAACRVHRQAACPNRPHDIRMHSSTTCTHLTIKDKHECCQILFLFNSMTMQTNGRERELHMEANLRNRCIEAGNLEAWVRWRRTIPLHCDQPWWWILLCILKKRFSLNHY